MDNQNLDHVASKCKNAVDLMNGRRPLSQKDAAEKVGIHVSQLQRYFISLICLCKVIHNLSPKCTLFQNRYMYGKSVGTNGRKRKITDEGIGDVLDDITNSALTLNAMTRQEVKLRFQEKIIQSQGLNSIANIEHFAPLSERTVIRYMKEMETPERKGKVKPLSRVEPFLNIRNAISKAAGLTAISKVCPIENMHSDDEVGIFLFGWHQTTPKLVSSKAADEFLRRNNISLSTCIDPDQQRAAHIGATVQAHTGNLTCFYLRIVDANFPEDFRTHQNTVHKPIVWRVDPSVRFYVVTCHPSVTDTVVSEYIGKLISSSNI